MSFLTSINLSDYLSVLDWTVFIAVLFITFASIFYGQKIKKTSGVLETLLMGRKLTLPLFTATLVATWYGGIFGVTKIAFNQGIYNFVTQGAFWYIAYIVFALFMVDKILQSSHSSKPN